MLEPPNPILTLHLTLLGLDKSGFMFYAASSIEVLHEGNPAHSRPPSLPHRVPENYHFCIRRYCVQTERVLRAGTKATASPSRP